jgi:polyphosphate:AMP phosphotransferase
MFTTAELGQSVDKQEFDEQVPDLRTQLVETQYRVQHADFSTIIIVAGNDHAGRNDAINRIHDWTDVRFLETHGFGHPTDEERERPRFWRYWRMLPADGRIAIFYGSWMRRPLMDRLDKNISDRELDDAIHEINNFEKLLVDDGTLLLKFWLHLSKDALKKRVREAEQDPEHHTPIHPRDRELLGQYERASKIYKRFVRKTSSVVAPWLIVESTDPRYRDLTIGRTILESLRKRIESPPPPTSRTHAMPVLATEIVDASNGETRSVLERVDLSKRLDKDEYHQKLEKQQSKMYTLGQKAFEQGLASVLVFEGWDAAGKGGTIRRLVKALDPRDYRMISIAAPTDEEMARHYLWRFWRHVPGRGRCRIFDRSWYGRVLVERIEGFASEVEWRRAYREINEFEEQLIKHGILLLKFWLHIDADEQLARFRAREGTPYKQHKMSPEDWRNRERWDAYEHAVNKMVQRTSTEYAPWHLIPANDKRYARVKVLKTVTKAFAARLD